MHRLATREKRKKKRKNVPCRVSFSCIFWQKVWWSALVPHPRSLKNFWLHTCTWALSLFARHTILNVRQCSDYVRQCFECLFLHRCSVICAVTFIRCILHQTHSEFWHIQDFFPSLCWHIQSYSALLRDIHAYWDIIKVYSGLFRHIQHPV